MCRVELRVEMKRMRPPPVEGWKLGKHPIPIFGPCTDPTDFFQGRLQKDQCAVSNAANWSKVPLFPTNPTIHFSRLLFVPWLEGPFFGMRGHTLTLLSSQLACRPWRGFLQPQTRNWNGFNTDGDSTYFVKYTVRFQLRFFFRDIVFFLNPILKVSVWVRFLLRQKQCRLWWNSYRRASAPVRWRSLRQKKMTMTKRQAVRGSWVLILAPRIQLHPVAAKKEGTHFYLRRSRQIKARKVLLLLLLLLLWGHISCPLKYSFWGV